MYANRRRCRPINSPTARIDHRGNAADGLADLRAMHDIRATAQTNVDRVAKEQRAQATADTRTNAPLQHAIICGRRGIRQDVELHFQSRIHEGEQPE